MKYIHLSDLHLGKRVNEFSMLDEQSAVLKQILTIIDEEAPDGVLIAGDVYDRTIPSAEAVELFDDFLVALSRRNVPTFIISGNHDSPERLTFGGRIMEASGIYLAPVYHGQVRPVTMTDAHGEVDVWLLPFVKPAHVRRFFKDEEIVTYTDAMRVAIGAMKIDCTHRNVLVTHQFVTGASLCESEDIMVGGTDNVDASVFGPFDYVALGHIHGPQTCGSERIRYCGTPLKYSFSEVTHNKSVTVVELGAKDSPLTVRTIPLTPVHEMRELRGSFEELTSFPFYADTTYTTDYVRITLTDENDIPDAVGRLRQIYTNLMRLDYDNTRTRSSVIITGAIDAERKSAYDLFADFFEQQNGQPMSEEQRSYMMDLIEKIEEDLQ